MPTAQGLPIAAEETKSKKDPDKACIDIIAQVVRFLDKEHVAQYLKSFSVSPKNLEVTNLFDMLQKLIKSEYCIRMASRELLAVTKMGLERDFDMSIPVDVDKIDYIADEVPTEPEERGPSRQASERWLGVGEAELTQVARGAATAEQLRTMAAQLVDMAEAFMQEPTSSDDLRLRRRIMLEILVHANDMQVLLRTLYALRAIEMNMIGERSGPAREPTTVTMVKSRIRQLLRRILEQVMRQEQAMAAVTAGGATGRAIVRPSAPARSRMTPRLDIVQPSASAGDIPLRRILPRAARDRGDVYVRGPRRGEMRENVEELEVPDDVMRMIPSLGGSDFPPPPVPIASSGPGMLGATGPVRKASRTGHLYSV